MVLLGYEGKMKNCIESKDGNLFLVELKNGELIPAKADLPGALSPLNTEELSDDEKFILNILKKEITQGCKRSF